MNQSFRGLAALICVLLCTVPCVSQDAKDVAVTTSSIKIGCLASTDSLVMAEILARMAERSTALNITRAYQYQNAGELYTALQKGEIDVAPTFTRELNLLLLKEKRPKDIKILKSQLKKKKLEISAPLGFEKTMGLMVLPAAGGLRDIQKISDLKKISTLRVAVGLDFQERSEGFSSLNRLYGLTLEEVKKDSEHLTEDWLGKENIPLAVLDRTDARVEKWNLQVLEDDKRFFRKNEGVILASKKFVSTHADVWTLLKTLENKMSDNLMCRLNAMVEFEKKILTETADIFLDSSQWLALAQKRPVPDRVVGNPVQEYIRETRPVWTQLWYLSKEHLSLVLIPLFFAVIIGIPLGLLVYTFDHLHDVFRYSANLFQTIPVLAGLCFLVVFLGLRNESVSAAAFLYALFPIAKGTWFGLKKREKRFVELGWSLGLSSLQMLRFVHLPMTMGGVLWGIKKGALHLVALVTLTALVGTGGFGKLIVLGLTLKDIPMILKGALAVSLLAILIRWIFEFLEWLLVPLVYQKEDEWDEI